MAGGVAVPTAALTVDAPVMLLAMIACLPICLTGRRVGRGEGAVLLLAYVGYTAYLLLVAS